MLSAVNTYGVTLTCGAATATVTNAAGDIQIVFPANGGSTARNFTLTANGATSSSVSFTQAAGEGGGGSTGPAYQFTLSWAANGDNAQFGFGLGSNGAGHYATLSDVKLADGSDVDLTDAATVNAIIAEATDNLDPAGSGVAGNGAAFVQDAIKFVLCAPVGANNAAKTIALGIQTPSSGTAFAKLVMYNSDGSAKTVARTWFIWCP